MTNALVLDVRGVYENSFADKPWARPNEAARAAELLDDDIKQELRTSAQEMNGMWNEFERTFGHRGPASSGQEASMRDPVVIQSAVRTYRAVDEQLRRMGLPASEKPQAWDSHYKSGNVGLEPAPWE
jgi:hypothetical protein